MSPVNVTPIATAKNTCEEVMQTEDQYCTSLSVISKVYHGQMSHGREVFYLKQFILRMLMDLLIFYKLSRMENDLSEDPN